MKFDVRSKRTTTAGRQARASQNVPYTVYRIPYTGYRIPDTVYRVPCTFRLGLVACRLRSASAWGQASLRGGFACFEFGVMKLNPFLESLKRVS